MVGVGRSFFFSSVFVLHIYLFQVPYRCGRRSVGALILVLDRDGGAEVVFVFRLLRSLV